MSAAALLGVGAEPLDTGNLLTLRQAHDILGGQSRTQNIHRQLLFGAEPPEPSTGQSHGNSASTRQQTHVGSVMRE